MEAMVRRITTDSAAALQGGPSKIAPREKSGDLLELRGNLRSPGPWASANRALTRDF